VVRDTITLTILNNRGTHEYVSNCGPYTWEANGQTYKTSGDKFVRHENADGCMVRDTITLTILNNRGTHEYVSNCGPYTWEANGQTYTKSGDKFVRHENGDGCVVRDTITLTILNNRGTNEAVTSVGPYTWERNGQTYKTSGNKYYRGENADGCVVRDTLVLTIVSAAPGDNPSENIGLGADDVLSQISVYPNPTMGQVQLSVNQAEKVEVLDMVGRIVASYENTNTLDLTNLADGTYTLRITMPEGVTLRKVVKR